MRCPAMRWLGESSAESGTMRACFSRYAAFQPAFAAELRRKPTAHANFSHDAIDYTHF